MAKNSSQTVTKSKQVTFDEKKNDCQEMSR